MLETINSRKEFVNNMLNYIKSKYDLADTQIFIFGSFLTDDYVPFKSYIDIGIYSENETKMYDIKYDLEEYLNENNLKHDIVIMHLSKNLWINITILTYGKQLTSYESERLFNYLLEMIQKWGFNPLEKLTRDNKP